MEEDIEELFRNHFKLYSYVKFHLGTERNDKDIEKPKEELHPYYKEQFFELLPYSKAENYHLTLDSCCMNLINQVFEKEIDDDTLIIYSNKEHPKVQELIEKQKHKLQINFNDINRLNIVDLQEARNYKKVLLYIIGTQVSSGEITPQAFFTKAKQFFVDNNIKHKILLDDCHGMFFVPRNYSYFDYITGTAHAYIEGYNMGILLSKEKGYIGQNSHIWLEDYIKKIQMIKAGPVQELKQVISNHCSKYLEIPGCSSIVTSPTIFSMKFEGLLFPENLVKALEPFPIHIEGINQYESYIRVRIPYLLKDISNLEKGLKTLDGIINLVKNR